MTAEISPIAAKLPFGKSQLFSYSIPEEMRKEIQPGSIVEMPLGARTARGVVFLVGERKCANSAPIQLKPIIRIIPNIHLSQYHLDLVLWMHKFYRAPIGIIFKYIIPEIPKKILKSEIESAGKIQKTNTPSNSGRRICNLEFYSNQNNRLEKYLELIKQYKTEKKQVLFLVPQIIDVETLCFRLKEILSESKCKTQPPHLNIAKLHSRLNMTEYYNNWANFQTGEADILIGTRQAILSPPPNLGLIIIDEYNDDDFKQTDQSPRFSAIETAKKICEAMKIELAIGSSSPNMERYDADAKNFHPPRNNVMIVDAQNEYYGKNFSPLSNKLQDLLQETSKNKKWALILVNRRGESAFIVCKDCGNVLKCPKCGNLLTLHIDKNKFLLCHRCNHKIIPPEKCPACQSHDLKFSSPGTQGIEKEILRIFKQESINLIRIDSDSVKNKKGIQDILEKLQKESGIIIGTQIASKIWLPKELELIGFLSADIFLNRPDFRASEKTFQIISELKGMLSKNGKMIVQTFNPENKTLQRSAAGDFENFYKDEITVRKQFNNPPFSRIIKLNLLGRDVREILQKTDQAAKNIAAEFKHIEILGPIPAENPRRGLFGKTLILKVFDWNEKMHLDLMKSLGSEWIAEAV